jgi:hypothetical protein
MRLPLVMQGVSKRVIRWYSKCYCVTSVMKTFTLKGVQIIHRSTPWTLDSLYINKMYCQNTSWFHCFILTAPPMQLLVAGGGVWRDGMTYPWSAWGSRQIRLPRTGRCHKEATWRSCARRGRGPNRTAQPSHSSGQTANTWSGCGCGRTGSSPGLATHRSGRDPLKQQRAVCKLWPLWNNTEQSVS